MSESSTTGSGNVPRGLRYVQPVMQGDTCTTLMFTVKRRRFDVTKGKPEIFVKSVKTVEEVGESTTENAEYFLIVVLVEEIVKVLADHGHHLVERETEHVARRPYQLVRVTL